MTYRTLIASIGLSVTVLASTADAQNRRQILQDVDANRDGLIQFSELQSFRARVFDNLDTNRNGVVDSSELAALEQQAANSGRSGPVSLDPYASDANRDGVITRQEFVNHIPPTARNADRNGDGALSRAELRALR